MHDHHPSDADIARADRRWRLATFATLVTVLGASFLAGFVILPIFQGRQIGLEPWDAICRAIGINPGTPAMRQPVSTARAQPVSRVAWSPAILDTLAGGNRERGAQLAEQTCSACHGENGVSPSGDFPHLAGQSAAAIYKQLHDYKTGARVNEQMTPVAQALTEQQLADIAAFYAGDNAFGSLGARVPVADEHTDELARIGDAARGLPACNSCHGSGVGGPIETPTLIGQHQAYLQRQLELYAQGGRTNDVYRRMREIASRLTPEERAALAEYYQGFGPSAQR